MARAGGAVSRQSIARRAALVLVASAALLCVLTVAAAPVLIPHGRTGVMATICLGLLVLVIASGAAMKWTDSGGLFELNRSRRIRAVLKHKGLTQLATDGHTIYPRLINLTGDSQSWSVDIKPLAGQSRADWERVGDAIALACEVIKVRFEDIGGGRLRMSAGYRALDARNYVSTSMVGDPIVSWREWLARVPIGHTDQGQTATVPLIDSHLLCAGITGAGKGSLFWSALLHLRPAIEAGVVRVWGFDPKRMELSIGRQFFYRYASSAEDMVKLLEEAQTEMLEVADRLGGHTRRFEPSVEHPLNILVVDELGFLSSLLPDRKLRQRADDALSGVLVLGRSVGYAVMGALQDPRKETLSFRDLFPTRVAMKLPKPMVDLVLGTGMYEAGALCDLIPRGENGAGVAFVVDESSGTPQCVRFTWCSDDLIRQAASELRLGPGDGGTVTALPIGA